MKILSALLVIRFSIIDVMIISLVGILTSNKKYKWAIIMFLVLGFLKSVIEIMLGI
jgi:hypothetical protein